MHAFSKTILTRQLLQGLLVFYRLFVFFITIVFLASCSVSDDTYEKPEVSFVAKTVFDDVDLDFYPKDHEKQTEDMFISRWWESLNDPFINYYVEALLKNNLQIMEVLARIEQAWEIRNINASRLYPALYARNSVGKSTQASEDLENVFGNLSSTGIDIDQGGRVADTSLQTSLNASWQFDLFGRIKREISASTGLYHASKFEKDALVHTLISELVSRYINICFLKEQQSLKDEIVKNQMRNFGSTRIQYKEGQPVKAADVSLAKQNLSSALSDLSETERQLKEEQFAFNALLGNTPDTEVKTSKIIIEDNVQPKEIPKFFPAQLLDRRPDLKVSRLALKSKTEDIKAAIANLYPDLSLTVGFGFEDEKTGNLFTADRLFSSIVGMLTTRIFEGGRLHAEIRYEKAQAKEAAIHYARQILNAMLEVQTVMNNEQNLSDRLKELEKSFEAAKQTEDSETKNYMEGVSPLFEFLDAKERCLMTKIQLIQVVQAKWNARIKFYLAIGGNWLDYDMEYIAPKGTRKNMNVLLSKESPLTPIEGNLFVEEDPVIRGDTK